MSESRACVLPWKPDPDKGAVLTACASGAQGSCGFSSTTASLLTPPPFAVGLACACAFWCAACLCARVLEEEKQMKIEEVVKELDALEMSWSWRGRGSHRGCTDGDASACPPRMGTQRWGRNRWGRKCMSSTNELRLLEKHVCMCLQCTYMRRSSPVRHAGMLTRRVPHGMLTRQATT